MSPQLPDNTILIDSDGMPWRSYHGRVKSTWTIEHSDRLAKFFGEGEYLVRNFGLTLNQLMIKNYGPWQILRDGHLEPYDLDAEVTASLMGE